MLPPATIEQEEHTARTTSLLLLTFQQLWRQMTSGTWGTWGATWEAIAPQAVEATTEAQTAVATASGTYTLKAATQQGIDVATTALDPSMIAGVAGDGRSLEGLLYGAVVETVQSYEAYLRETTERFARKQALSSGLDWLGKAGGTAVADASRAAEAVVIAEQPEITGWVRLIEPGACSRCVVLAGRFYHWSEGFERHPRCRCQHVPATEENQQFTNSRTNANLYFDRLSREQQDRTFTAAGAEAIRLGANIAQVVNARRGMQTAQLNGRKALVTTSNSRGGKNRRRSRLMPETILAEAKDKPDAVRLLRLYGYLN